MYFLSLLYKLFENKYRLYSVNVLKSAKDFKLKIGTTNIKLNNQ